MLAMGVAKKGSLMHFDVLCEIPKGKSEKRIGRIVEELAEWLMISLESRGNEDETRLTAVSSDSQRSSRCDALPVLFASCF